MRDDAVPELSVIVITPDDYQTVRATVRALGRQTVRERIEVVFCAPSAAQLALDDGDLEGFAGHQVVEIGELTSTSAARTAGIRAARAKVVALSEDHCFPAPTWAEAILARHREPWSGVGAAFVNGNPQSVVSWANFIIEYGEWADPAAGGEARHIPGHNSSYKRAALLEHGAALAEILEAESAMQWQMASRGHRFYLEPRARVHHVNFSLFGPSLSLRFWGGRLFAANRARSWGIARRALYCLASPLIPALRLARALKTRARLESAPPLLTLMPALVVLLIVDGCGEMIGYAAGAGSAMPRLSDWGEFHRWRFVRRREWQQARAAHGQ